MIIFMLKLKNKIFLMRYKKLNYDHFFYQKVYLDTLISSEFDFQKKCTQMLCFEFQKYKIFLRCLEVNILTIQDSFHIK